MADDDTTQLVELVTSGTTIEQAAKRLGISRATANRRLVAAECTDRDRRPRTTLAERQRIYELLDADLSRAEVARRVQRAKSTVVTVDLSRRNPNDQVKRMRQPRRCDGCGMRITIDTCIRCAASQPWQIQVSA